MRSRLVGLTSCIFLRLLVCHSMNDGQIDTSLWRRGLAHVDQRPKRSRVCPCFALPGTTNGLDGFCHAHDCGYTFTHWVSLRRKRCGTSMAHLKQSNPGRRCTKWEKHQKKINRFFPKQKTTISWPTHCSKGSKTTRLRCCNIQAMLSLELQTITHPRLHSWRK